VHRWEPAGPPRAVVQIAHGMAEHGGRYERAAAQLNAAGYAVYVADHRGHGRTAVTPGDLGYFADHNGWLRAVDDLYAVRRRIAQDHPELPVILLGHSMGSLMAQQYLFSHGDSIAGAVLSSTGGGTGLLAHAGAAAAALERLRLGPRGRSPILQTLTFGAYNNRFKPNRTEYDWLSRDPVEVDKYVADPLCGFALTTQGWADVFSGVANIERMDNIRRVPPGLPIYLFSGDQDPVGRETRGVLWLIEKYRKVGVKDVQHRFYPGGRHEMLNETNRDDVVQDLIAWLNAVKT
jgi:alpha-beta hydrolase superfamily lysophospholipase